MSHKWNLHFNESKCILMQYHKPKGPTLSHDYTMERNLISSHISHKDLGIVLQSDLSWSTQYDIMCSKAYKIIALLKRSFCMANSVSTKRKLYLSLVRSKLTYCSQLWRPALIRDITQLENVQRRATRYILSRSSPQLDYKDRLITLNLLPLMYILELADIMFLVTSLKNPTDRFNILD